MQRTPEAQGRHELADIHAVALDPHLILAEALLGEWQLEQNHPAAAIPVLEQTLLLAPNADDIEHNLALAYLGSGHALAAVQQSTARCNTKSPMFGVRSTSWPCLRGRLAIGRLQPRVSRPS